MLRFEVGASPFKIVVIDFLHTWAKINSNLVKISITRMKENGVEPYLKKIKEIRNRVELFKAI